MTAFAFMLGVVPMALATGPGAEIRQAPGVTVFSGMLGLTFFALFLTPVFYVTIRSITRRLRPLPRPAELQPSGAAEEGIRLLSPAASTRAHIAPFSCARSAPEWIARSNPANTS